jgi:dihydroxyacetone kinase-like predicted kinase
MLDDELVIAGDDMLELARGLLERAQAQRFERITIYYGADVHEADALMLAEALAAHHRDQEFEVVSGGQALYPYIISVE